MTKIKMIIICVSIMVLVIAPRNSFASAEAFEPSFQSEQSSHKSVSENVIETALSGNGVDQLGQGVVMLAIVVFLALRKR